MNFQLKKPSAVLKHINSTNKKNEPEENCSDHDVKQKTFSSEKHTNNEKNGYVVYVLLLLFVCYLNFYSLILSNKISYLYIGQKE